MLDNFNILFAVLVHVLDDILNAMLEDVPNTCGSSANGKDSVVKDGGYIHFGSHSWPSF